MKVLVVLLQCAQCSSHDLCSVVMLPLLCTCAAHCESKNKVMFEFVEHLLGSSGHNEGRYIFRDGLRLTADEKKALQSEMRSDSLHPASYVRTALSMHCEEIALSLLTSKRHPVSCVLCCSRKLPSTV